MKILSCIFFLSFALISCNPDFRNNSSGDCGRGSNKTVLLKTVAADMICSQPDHGGWSDYDTCMGESMIFIMFPGCM